MYAFAEEVGGVGLKDRHCRHIDPPAGWEKAPKAARWVPCRRASPITQSPW